MSGKIMLTITAGTKQGEKFEFDQHDTLLFGRLDDCHLCLPDDTYISRHHFILEVNPPDARFRDLGSRNGTYVNGIKYGGREKHETAEEGAKYQHPHVDLHDGDELKAGKTIFRVHVDSGVSQLERVYCQRCHKDVSAEVGSTRRGDYVCVSCQQSSKYDRAALLLALLQQAKRIGQVDGSISIPNYQIEGKLGEGGMGSVYLVRNIQTGQRAALKVMLSKVAVDAKSSEKFKREIEVTRSLRHKNVVELIESGAQGSIFYFLLELCEGGSVYDLMKRRGGKLSHDEAGPIMLQALEGLTYVHQQRVVHRDLKPQNLLLSGKEGQWIAKVADLGLAKNFDKAGFSGMTVTGSVAGSLYYMPREQVTNFKYFEPVSDVWSMGATCYHILTGTFPREQLKKEEPLEMILRNEIIPIRKRDPRIPQPLANVIDRSLASINDRYQSAGEMCDALAKALKK